MAASTKQYPVVWGTVGGGRSAAIAGVFTVIYRLSLLQVRCLEVLQVHACAAYSRTSQPECMAGSCAVCSTWGCNRVQEHQSLAPLQLILPVLTAPEVVQHAVAALHSGSIALSMCNVEAILVLANSIGVIALLLLISLLPVYSLCHLASWTLWGCR